MKVYGITHYATYDIGTDIYTTSTAPFKLTVGEDGFTPYFYGYFTDAEEPNVKVWIDAKEAYTRFCSKDIFNAGQSGKMTIPTEDSHNGWVDGLYFNARGAQFKMVAVEGGSFTMGDPESTSQYYTAHKVTLTGYCIGETEVTKLLYYKMMSTSNTNEPNMACTMAKSTIGSLLTKLNELENVGFDFPTEAQWEFAAIGGIKTHGYKYSGSDNIDEVAWYTYNSDGNIHDVKLKKPNELGIYDMTGNVQEYVKDYYGAYSDSAQIDPYHPHSGTGNRIYVIRGGYNSASSDYCTNTYRRTYDIDSYSSSSPTSAGGRIVLNWN